MQCLRRKKPVSCNSNLASLTPYLDSSGIMRVGGKIQHASTPELAKHPIILSLESQLSTLIIREIHECLVHSSTERTLHKLRQQFHILRPREAIQRVIKKCFPCKHRTAQPFSNVGIDYFGPFHLTIFRGQVKRYRVMLTCLDCRAVHLEIAHSYPSTPSYCQQFIPLVLIQSLSTAWKFVPHK